MADTVQVRRLRVSYVIGWIHDSLQVVGEPVAFAHRLVDPEPVLGLPVTLPFGQGLEVDNTFWSRIAERPLTGPISQEAARKLRRAAVPLRCRGTLNVAADVPRLEAHLHPFGLIVMATIDMSWAQPVDLVQVSQKVHSMEHGSTVVAFGGTTHTTTLGQAAAVAADAALDLLTDAERAEPLRLNRYRLITVIDGTSDVVPSAMPDDKSPLHLAMHQLADGTDVVARPDSAFVAQWSNAGYVWPPTSLLYMLDRGSALFLADRAADAWAGPQGNRSDRHRWLLLLIAYLSATTGLVRAANSSSSILFPAWADTTAKRLGLLFGPARAFLDWGLAPQALMLRTGAGGDVARRLGAPLAANPDYPLPKYG